jgi:hypothetical protein
MKTKPLSGLFVKHSHILPNGDLIAGMCPLCGENIDERQPPTKESTIEAAWKVHLETEHPGVDQKQIVARILRDAKK